MSIHVHSGFMYVWIGCMLSVSVPNIGAAADAHTVNLYRGEIDGVLFSHMTLETIISRFGQPSALEHNDIPHERYRSKVSYHDLGLSFWLQRPSENATFMCRSIVIYMVKIWDGKAGKVFSPFVGRLSKNINNLWNPSRMETEFKAFYPQRYTRDQKEKILKYDEIVFLSSIENYTVLYIDSLQFKVDLFYNNSIQALETIHISVNKIIK